MTNMYSVGSMGMMNSMNGMYGNIAGMSGENVHQSFKNKYGVGYADSGLTRPYAQPYPTAIIPRHPKPAIEQHWFGRFLKKCFCF